MDAVGLILAEKEREGPAIGVGISLGVLLHAAVLGALIISAIGHPARFVAPRAVAVRLMQAGTIQGGAAAVSPPAEPEKPKIVKPAEEAPPPPSEKAKLLPAKEEKKKPAPAAQAKPSASAQPKAAAPSGAETSKGTMPGPAGAGGNVGIGGATFDQPDFNYSYYVERMVVTIGMNWFKPGQSPISPKIHFRIARDGTISDPEIERSSGLPYVDRAALRAVLASSPLPPLPSEFSGGSLGVHLVFE